MPNDCGAVFSRGPRRVLYLITDLDIGGAEKCCAQLAIGLDRRLWQPAVCSLIPPGDMGQRLRDAGVATYSLGARHAGHAPAAVSRLVRLLNQLRPTLLHTFLFHANVLGRAAALLAGTPHVVSSIRVAERRYRHHLILENLTCRFSERVVCVSNAVHEYTRRHSHVPAQRLAVIPNGIDWEIAAGRMVSRSELGVPSDGVVALYVGRLDYQKGVDVLVRALARARQIDPRLHVLLAGSGPDHASLVELSRQLHVDASAHFLGWRNDVPALMHTADFFVMPSRWEGMPNALLEAMGAGLPVIATRAEGSTQLVRNGYTGLLVAIDCPDELARAMTALAANSALRIQYGECGQQVARHEFSLTHMIERYQELYESLLS